MGIVQDFKAFAFKGNVIDLAVAVISFAESRSLGFVDESQETIGNDDAIVNAMRCMLVNFMIR